MEGDPVVRGDAGREPVVDELAVARAAILLAVVVRAGAAGEETEAVRRPRCGPNESVTPCSNQQIIPALAPQRTIPCSHASRRRVSMPCTRQIASMFAVFRR